MWTRREFLQTTSLTALSSVVPAFVAQTARAAAAGGDRKLVILQLDGGNDGLNTIVPRNDEEYGRRRPTLALSPANILKVSDEVGLHSSLAPLAALMEDQRCCILQGVGYPNPDRSHFRSMAIWHTAHFDDSEHNSYGWLGRALDSVANENQTPMSTFVGREDLPVALRGRRSVTTALETASDTRLELARSVPDRSTTESDDVAAFVRRVTASSFRSSLELAKRMAESDNTASYPATRLAKNLRTVSQLLRADSSSRVFYTIHGGFDTHSGQAPTHTRLLREMSDALAAFMDDIRQSGLADQVLVLVFSEFGRRVSENASEGTDHGTAGPVFLLGQDLPQPMIGTIPDLSDLDDGDIRMQLDFRSVYATILEEWLQLSQRDALRQSFPRVPLFRKL